MLAVAVCFLTLAVAADMKTNKIPNALNLTGLATGLLVAYGRAGPTGLVETFGGVALMFGASFVLYLVQALRGGDGKLLCALTAFYGMTGGFRILLFSMIVAAAGGVPLMLLRKRRKGDRTQVHYSIAIAMGTAMYLTIYGGVR